MKDKRKEKIMRKNNEVGKLRMKRKMKLKKE